MPMSDGITRLRKVAFEIGGKMFRFAINPQGLVYNFPQRTTAVKTKSRIIVQDFQQDLATITISGTTGFNPTGRKKDRGFNKIKEMKRFIESYASAGGNGNPAPDDFYFHDRTNDESYAVHLSPESISITQDENSPLTHRYEIRLVILRKAGEPPEDSVSTPEIGNRFPSLPKGRKKDIPSPNLPGGYYGEDDFVPEGTEDIYESGNSEGNNIYESKPNNDAINPQTPSRTSYEYGRTGLGYVIGYYGRTR